MGLPPGNSTNKRSPRCPSCGVNLDDLAIVRYDQSFRCPNCKSNLKVPRSYLLAGYWLAFVLSLALSFAIGLRSVSLILGMLVFLIPSMFTVSILQRRIFPPKLVVERQTDSILS